MVRKSSSEGGCESDANARNDASEQVAGPPDMGLVDGSKKAAVIVPPPRPCHSSRSFEEVGTPLRKVVGETTAETMSLLSASVENFHPDNSSELSGRSCKQAASSSFQYHVLAVDDNRIDQRVVEKLLRTSSYKVTTVNSALRALELLGLSDSPPASFKKLDINLIMTDYCMPGMTGYDLLKRVKAKTSALKEIPVVVMSSENDSTRIKRCLAEGAEEFIIKPVHLSDVKRLMGHIRCASTTTSSGTDQSSGSTCGKRKADPSDEVSSPERRPRPSELLVT